MKYRDLDIFLRVNQETKDFNFVSGNSSIVQSIKNIVLTKLGERPFDVSFGTNVVDQLFNIPSLAEMSFLTYDIKKVLESKEPRIIVDKVDIIYPVTDKTDDDVKINIEYYINMGSKLSNAQTLLLTVEQ